MSDSPMYDAMSDFAKSSGIGMNVPAGAPIATALDQHDAEIANLIDEVHMLLGKIEPVIGPEGSESAMKDPGQAEVPASNVTNRINTGSRNLASLKRQVREVRLRVEL